MAVSKSTLRIITVENVGETFNQSVVKLMYTPKKFVIHDAYRLLYVVESDHQSVPHPSSQKANGTHNGEENGQVCESNLACEYMSYTQLSFALSILVMSFQRCLGGFMI